MKTIILSSKSNKQFLVFETSKETSELFEHVKAMDFTPEQAVQKELIHADDLEAEIFSQRTFNSNKDYLRRSAIEKKEKDGYTYVGANRGSQETPQYVEKQAGISLTSTLFLVLCQVAFWLIIGFSVYIALKVNLISGVTLGISTVIGFGIVFILGDILKNIVEINQKTEKK